MRLCTLLLISGIASSAAHASDGVFEINSDCAAVGGCFAGDSSGYPVTITESGSYRLTGNLTTSSVDTTLISISVDNVTIDLNGFSLIGPVTCSGSPNVCSGSGSGDGISVSSRDFSVSIFNGTVHGMGDTGIILGSSSIIENVKVIENGGTGIDVRSSSLNSVVRNVVANRNRQGVFALGAAVFVIDSTMMRNTARGISSGFCSNIVSFGNGTDSFCSGIAPNSCEDPTACD